MIKKGKSSAKGLKDTTQQPQQPRQQLKKLSEYGKQLQEKQRVKNMYGMRERQFRNFFKIAKKSKDATGSALLVLLERRLDNVVYRLKIASTTSQARQLVVHGHLLVNGKKAYSPSLLIESGDVITLSSTSVKQEAFMKTTVEKNLAAGIKLPSWLEFDRTSLTGKVLRLPVRDDLQATINENFIVELYSK